MLHFSRKICEDKRQLIIIVVERIKSKHVNLEISRHFFSNNKINVVVT